MQRIRQSWWFQYFENSNFSGAEKSIQSKEHGIAYNF